MSLKTNSGNNLYNKPVKAVLSEMKVGLSGLSKDEVRRRLKQFGRNELSTQGRSWWKRLIEPFASVFVMVLVVALVISVIANHPLDAIIIGVIVVVNALIYYFQQASVSRALKALRRHDRSTIAVRRAGQVTQVASEDLVPGDIVLLYEGVKVPGDGRIMEANQLSIDESVLTGESLPVRKDAAVLHGEKAVYEQANMAFKGTFVYSGSGEMVLTGTGNNTMLGQITTLVSRTDFEQSPIEKKIDTLVKQLISIIMAIAGVFFATSLLRGFALEEGLRYTLAIIVSAVPEGLPVALTVVLFVSARKMAGSKALVKKISSMETIGAVTLIATDKTGTLTKNKLSVADRVYSSKDEALFLQAVAGSLNGSPQHRSDVLDTVLEKELTKGKRKPKGRKIKEYPFNQALRVSGSLWQDGNKYTLYFKGAPEAILKHSTRTTSKQELQKALAKFASQGFRNIAFAHQTFAHKPTEITAKMLENCTLNGIVGLADGMRRGIPKAIREAHQAGIKVVMLTGDHRVTAAHIAAQARLITDPSQVGEENILAKSNLPQIRKLLASGTRVFARVLPEHKHKFLKAVKGREITAMTGDGINDIPALVEANVGLAMGSGTDATKESSDLVLLNDNFNTIITAVRMGRTVISNIRKMLYYLLSTNLGEALTMIVALMAGMPLPLSAVQILWINFVTDGVTVLPIGLSPSEDGQMKQPPRKPSEPILDFSLLSRLFMVAIIMAGSTLWLFNFYLDKTGSYAYANTVAFLVLVVCQWTNSANANFEFKSWLYNFVRPNSKLILGLIIAVILQVLVMWGPLQSAFQITELELRDLLIASLPAIVILIAVDIHKGIGALIRNWRQKPKDA